MKKILTICLGFMLVASAACAGGNHSAEPYTGSAAFEKLKTLEGSWIGTVTEPGENETHPTQAVYEISSGSTALVEKLNAGTPHEMVSLYNDENGSLVMTHYCLMRNQPKLKVVRADEKTVELEMTEANGVKMTDDHMHALKITFDGPDEITQEWSGYQEGKLSEKPVVVKLKRLPGI